MNIETVVIPVAGLGTRLLPISSLVAKEYLPLGNKPAIQHIAEEAAAAGMTKIVFVASERKSDVARLFGPNDDLTGHLTGEKSHLKDRFWVNSQYAKVSIEICIQERQLGLGHAILCAKDAVGDSAFAVSLGDCLIGLPGQFNGFTELLKSYHEQKADLAILFEQVPVDEVNRYGIAKLNDSLAQTSEIFQLEDIVEKPTIDVAPSRMAVCGRYVFKNEIFDWLKRTEPGKNGEIQLTDAIARMIQSGGNAIGMRMPCGVKRYDVGDIRTYVQAFVEFAMDDAELKPFVETAVRNSK